MTQYYIDADNGLDTNDGLTAGGTPPNASWKTLDKFTEAARSAGDIATCRRGMTAEYDNGTQLDFISNGTILAPITIEADYDDSWSDFVNSAQTYTPVYGALTMEASATITGIVAGDWVYNTTDGDDPREFSYEVKSVSGTTLTLYLPWKGSTGATKTLKVMGASPRWQVPADTLKMNFSGDNYWKFQGLKIQGNSTDSNAGIIDLSTSVGTEFKDVVIVGNNAWGYAIVAGTSAQIYISKTRTFDGLRLIVCGDTIPDLYINDCLLDGNSVASSAGIDFQSTKSGNIFIENTTFQNHASSDIALGANGFASLQLKLRNCKLDSAIGDNINNTGFGGGLTAAEDMEGVLNKSSVYDAHASADFTPTYESDTATVRSGGSTISIKVTPGANIATTRPGLLKLLELPIYATTSSKTYDIYFRPDATANWTADPTAAELWVELEAWGHATNNYRKITKSTGVIDMNGSTAWQALSVTVAPAQAGVAYLRVWYGKPKEAAKTNVFFVDPKPVIT